MTRTLLGFKALRVLSGPIVSTRELAGCSDQARSPETLSDPYQRENAVSVIQDRVVLRA